MSLWSGGHDRSFFGCCSSSLAPNTDEVMSASSRIAQEMDEGDVGRAKEKVRYWWSIDLEGEVEELEVGFPWTATEGDSTDPEGEMNHQSDGEKAAVEEEENLGKLTDDGMEVEMGSGCRRATSREC